MKKKLVNRKVVNSIGVGILAAMTTCTSVYAATDGIPQEEENKQEENNEIEEQLREETEEEKQLTEAKDSLDEIVTEGVEEKIEETGESEENPIKVEADNIDEEIKSALEGSGEKIDEIQKVVTDLKDQNTAIETNNNIIEEIANSTEAGSMNQMTENIAETEKAAQDAVKRIEESKKTAEDVAGNVEEAQQKVYESSEAAQAAKEQAQTEVQEAEEALTAAQDANDEAEKKVELLEAELEAVEQEKAKADAALEAAREAEAAAREALAELEKQVTQNSKGGYKYSGNAEEAIEKAKEALLKAQADVADAESVVKATQDKMKETEEKFKEAYDELTTAEGDLAEANIKLGEAKEEFKKAGEALDAANSNQANAQTRHDNAVTNEGLRKKELEEVQNQNDICIRERDNAQKLLDDYTKNGTLDKLMGEIKENQEAMKGCLNQGEKDPYGDGYYVEGQKLTQKLVEYQLLKKGEIEPGDQIDFTKYNDVVGSANRNQNYVMASYEKEGETYVKYYDYEPDPKTGEITVIEKKLKSYIRYDSNTHTYLVAELCVLKQKDGSVVYKIKDGAGVEYKTEKVKFENGYYEVEDTVYKGIYMPKFEKDGNNKGTPIFEGNGDSASVVKGYDEGREPLSSDLTKKIDEADIAAGKLTEAQTTYDEASEELKAADAALTEAKDTVNQKTTERDNAQGQVASADADVKEKEKLKEEKDKAVNALKEVLEGLRISSESAATGVKNTKAIQIAVEKAYDKVEQAIQNLVNLSANAVDEAQYEALIETYDRAVAQYQSALAAKGVYGENLEAVKKAVDRARAAAEAEFRYNSSNNEGDNTQGGTTDGGETGGTTGGEETGGTTGGEEAGGTTGGGTTDEGGTGTGGTTTDDGVTGGGADGGEDEGGAVTDTGAGTDTAAPTLVTAIADAEVPLAPTALTADTNTVMANAGAAMNANRRAAGNNIVRAAGEDELAGEEEDGLIAVEDEDVPLAAIDPETDEAEEKEEDLTVVADEEVPLANLDLEQEQNKMSWWWLLIVAICGATGYEMYRRHKKNQEQEEVR